MLEPNIKKIIIDEFKTHEGDTGSPEVQIAILTRRINDLNELDVIRFGVIGL